jgi:beta-aspartyl-peptidase (threonine type)
MDRTPEDLVMRIVPQAAFALLVLSTLLPAARALESSTAASPEEQVAALLRAQADAWTRGDLEAFTSVYAEDASFVSPNGLTRGRREVLERYRKRYPDKAAMGKLTLDVIEARTFPAGKTADGVSVVARWRLEYPGEADRKTAEGLTLIVLRRAGGSWEIVQDASM